MFDFHVQVRRPDSARHDLFGVCRCDERDGTFEVQLQDTVDQQQEILQRETSSMIHLEPRSRHWLEWLLLVIFAAALGLAIFGAVLRSL